MANNTSNTNNTILYNASTRENFNDWKHTLDSLLTKHPDKLLTVAQNGKLSASATIKLKAQYKQLALTFDGAAEKEHYDEANSQVYYLIIPRAVVVVEGALGRVEDAAAFLALV